MNQTIRNVIVITETIERKFHSVDPERNVTCSRGL